MVHLRVTLITSKVTQYNTSRTFTCNTNHINTNTHNTPQMENIEIFLNGAAKYGIQSNSLFPTADLFDGRNMAMVISTILLLGSEVRKLVQLD